MEGFNYHHLFYFYTVARCGTIAKASAELHLTQPTISEQLRLLEASLESKLFEKSGRNLVLTETGKNVLTYAEKIFALGQELKNSVDGRSEAASERYVIGVTRGVPSLLMYRLLKPVVSLGGVAVCYQDRVEALLARLATHEVDLIVSETPVPRTVNVSAASHKLGECGVSFLAAEKFAASHRSKFPQTLNGELMLLPPANTERRVSVERWLNSQDVHPKIAAECEDSALLAHFCKAGSGVIAVPTAIEKDAIREYGVKVVGRTDAITEHFFLISTERKLRGPAAVAICNYGRDRVFS